MRRFQQTAWESGEQYRSAAPPPGSANRPRARGQTQLWLATNSSARRPLGRLYRQERRVELGPLELPIVGMPPLFSWRNSDFAPDYATVTSPWPFYYGQDSHTESTCAVVISIVEVSNHAY